MRTADVDLNGCGACGGIWVDKEGARRVVEKPYEVFADLAGRAARNATEKGKRSDAPACAVCAAALEPIVAPKVAVTLDICRAHGTWFDALELATLVHAMQNPAAAMAAEPVASSQVTCAGCGVPMFRDHANITAAGPKCDGCWTAEQYDLVAKGEVPRPAASTSPRAALPAPAPQRSHGLTSTYGSGSTVSSDAADVATDVALAVVTGLAEGVIEGIFDIILS